MNIVLREIWSFSKFNIGAITATCSDYILFYTLHAFTSIHYAVANFLGASLGAFVAFTLGRKWIFGGQGLIWGQSWRFILVVCGSILLNTLGILWVTEGIHIDERIAKIMVAACVGLFYNFPAQRYFVFRF